MSATSNPTVKAVPTASTASKDLPFVGQVFFLTGRGKECKAPEGCGMERGRLRPILSLKTSTETFGSNPSSRNGFATTTAAKFWPFTTPQQSLYCIATPESSPAYFTTAPYRTDFPESGFPSQRSLVGLSPLNSAPYFTAEVNLTHPNPVYPPHNGPCRTDVPESRPPQQTPCRATSLEFWFLLFHWYPPICCHLLPAGIPLCSYQPRWPARPHTIFSPLPSTSQSGSDRPKKEAGATNAPASLPNATLSTKSTCRADPESWPSAE